MITETPPIALSSPLERAYLKPRDGCLYDTEKIFSCNLRKDSTLRLFDRPYASHLNATESKDYKHTNLNQSGMLDYPREVMVREFGVFIDDGIDRWRAEVLEADFEFVLLKSRWFGDPNIRFEFPLSAFPNNCSDSGIHEILTTREVLPGNRSFEKNKMPSSLMLQLPEKDHFKIHPGEAFFVTLKWRKDHPSWRDGLVGGRIIVAIGGQIYNPE